MTLSDQISKAIRTIPDFPKDGIAFKDITPLLLNPSLFTQIVEGLRQQWADVQIDAVAGIESRGFLFGPSLAQALGVPFVLIRKAGKLPADVYQASYELEYGTSQIEMHKDAVKPGQRILIHDDLLATGGTALACLSLLEMAGATCSGFSFLVNLDFLPGLQKLKQTSNQVQALVHY